MINYASLKVITSIYQKIPLREWKGKPQDGKLYLHQVLLKRGLYLKCIKNSCKAIRKIWTTKTITKKMNKRFEQFPKNRGIPQSKDHLKWCSTLLVIRKT